MPDSASFLNAQSAWDEIFREKIEKIERRRCLSKLLISLIATAAITFLLFAVVFGIAVVKGTSMVPAYLEGDIVLFCRLTNKYRRGDVVMIKTDEAKADHIKRIVALPGQTVDIDERAAVVVVNGEKLAEPYIYTATERKESVAFPLTLKENEYFVLGDKRTNSLDSRSYGPLSGAEIDGKAILVLRTQK